MPQIGCEGPQCRDARDNPSRRRFVSSLLIADPATSERWLIDATPDFPDQVEIANALQPLAPTAGVARPNLFQAILLTHAHIGHYSGLVHLGREVYGAPGTLLLTSEKMQSFLETNGPWSLLSKLGHVRFARLTPGVAFSLSRTISVTPWLVPHRDEFSDTLAFEIKGPSRSVLFLPDIDKWDKWDQPLKDVLARVDRAYIDGTFFGEGEIPGRAMSEIPHPFITETMDHLQHLPQSTRSKVVFIHLNHTNPATSPGSSAAREVVSRGYSIATRGDVFQL